MSYHDVMAQQTTRFRGLATALTIVAAWVLVTLAWTPPSILMQGLLKGPAISPPPEVFLFVLMNFLPWMAFTPLILRLGRKWPIAEGRILGPVTWHILAGLVIIPVATFAGALLSAAITQRGHIASSDWPRLLSATAITGFYSVPVYVAVVAIGQAVGYFERYRSRERLLARAQLRALQAQINPHFLFNTLNAISALGYRDPARADTALSRLGELIRLALAERPQEIAFKEELAFARGYLDLYELLLGDRLDVDFDIAKEVWNAAVPAMLLQPLIENAIVHGVAKRAGGGRISLSASLEGNRLSLAIANDVPSVDIQVRAGSGIGLSNVRERLSVLYGDACSFVMKRENGQMVRVSLLLPFRAMPVAE